MAPRLSPQGARDILSPDFDEFHKDRMRQLSAKARAGTLTPDDDAQAARYELIGHVLNIMQSKARQSLKRQQATGAKKRRAQ
jgi:hypothetical protein